MNDRYFIYPLLMIIAIFSFLIAIYMGDIIIRTNKSIDDKNSEIINNLIKN